MQAGISGRVTLPFDMSPILCINYLFGVNRPVEVLLLFHAMLSLVLFASITYIVIYIVIYVAVSILGGWLGSGEGDGIIPSNQTYASSWMSSSQNPSQSHAATASGHSRYRSQPQRR